MIQYAKFGITCTTTDRELVKIYEEFKKKCANYCIDEEMELYYIPIKSSMYEYAHQLALCHPTKGNMWDDSPQMYITESNCFQTKYDKSDFENAIAYIVNFFNFAYDYENITSDEFVGSCCNKPSWTIEACFLQNKNYMIPKSEFGKKNLQSLC